MVFEATKAIASIKHLGVKEGIATRVIIAQTWFCVKWQTLKKISKIRSQLLLVVVCFPLCKSKLKNNLSSLTNNYNSCQIYTNSNFYPKFFIFMHQE